MEKVSARAENLIPISETELAFLARANGLEKSENSPCIGNGMSARAGKATGAYACMVVYFSALLKFVMKSQQYFSLPHRAEIRHFITLLILFSFAC